MPTSTRATTPARRSRWSLPLCHRNSGPAAVLASGALMLANRARGPTIRDCKLARKIAAPSRMTFMAAVPAPDLASPFEQLRLARQVVRAEGQTLLALADRIGEEFCLAVALLHSARGSVIVSGMGKAGIIGQKIA